ncbi:MAG: Cob(I)yrinic acid a,c-diamide adenosyltransferase [Turneriella sp.]|nr:Cob(I)yrinic acid a,c-diamide adenosyltransferase [Turneriella sp.]
MKIYTKTGDKGETSLFGGGRVKKSDARVEAYGTVDELNSYVGVLKASLKNTTLKKEPEFTKTLLPFLSAIQNHLFDLGAELATGSDKFREKLSRRINEEDIIFLEKSIDTMQEKLPQIKHFILPDGTFPATYAHICRTVARRAERAMVASESTPLILIAYINRLSDYFFVLSRYLNFLEDVHETLWQSS